MKYSILASLIACVLLIATSLPIISATQQHDSTIVIFKFKDLSKNDDYAYYSYIIPDALAVEIKNRTKLNVRTHPVTIPYVKSTNAAEYESQILYLARKGGEFDADYTISGSYEIKNNKIHISTQLFNIENKKLIDVGSASEEISVLIFDIIDSLTNKINEELQKFAQPALAKKDDALPTASTSPFLPIYRAIENIIIYGEHGSIDLTGRWQDIYKNADYYAIGFRYALSNFDRIKKIPFVQNSSASASYHYFIIPAKNISSTLMVSGIVCGYSYDYPIIQHFTLSAEINLGMMFSTLRIYSNMPGNGGPQIPERELHSNDLLFRISGMIGFNFFPLVFGTGFTFNRIFYSGEPLEFSTIFFMMGIQL